MGSKIQVEAYASAVRIGASLSPLYSKTQRTHVSLACSADFDKTVRDGGRSESIKEALVSLSEIPKEDGTIETPYGPLIRLKGIPLWRTYCRKEVFIDYINVDLSNWLQEPDSDFEDSPQEIRSVFPYPKARWSDEKIPDFKEVKGIGSPLNETFLSFQGVKKLGFDESLGLQIFALAYLEYLRYCQEGPIPTRTATVQEPGYKTRVITTTKWWANVIQQPAQDVDPIAVTC